MKKLKTFLIALTLCMLVSWPAFAQGGGGAPSVTLSTATIVITLFSLLAGFVSQAINTGSIFGISTLPKPWLPYLTLFGTFLAAFVASLSATGALGPATWFTAFVAGASALLGTTVGVTAHQHLAAKPGTETLRSVPPKALLLFAAMGWAGSQEACSAATTNQVLADVFDVTQTLCLVDSMVTAVIPAGTPVATVVTDIKTDCPMLTQDEATLEAFITSWETLNPAPAGSLYKPPSVRRRKAGL